MYKNPKIIFSALLLILSFSAFAAKGPVTLRVADYGAKGDGRTDDYPVLAKIFDKASRSRRPVEIIFEKDAIYRIGAHPEDCYSRLMLYKASDVTVDGQGATLMIHPSSRAFGLYDSENIVVKNFKIDYAPLPYTQGRITAIDNKAGWLEFKIDEGFPMPAEGDMSYYDRGKMSDCITGNGENNKFYQGHSKIRTVKAIGDRTYHVTYDMRRQHKARPGDIFAMKVTYPSPKNMRNDDDSDLRFKGEYPVTASGSISALRARKFTLQNITSYASPVMTVNFRSCRDYRIDGLRIVRKPGRIVAGNSDGIHLKGNESQPIIENSYFEGTMDDSIHIKISGDIIKEVQDDRTFRIVHSDIAWDNTNLDKGLEVLIYDPEKKTQLAMCKIKRYDALNYREGWVTLDRPVEGLHQGIRVYLQGVGESIVRNCGFGTQLQRAILTHQPARVENCVIEDNGKGFELCFGTGLIEGPPSQRLTVLNTVFKNLVYCGFQVRCPSHEYDQKGNPQLIVKNCSFEMPAGVPVLKVVNSDGILFENNVIKAPDVDKKVLFQLEDSPFHEINSKYTVIQ